MELRGCGVLGHPLFAGDDGLFRGRRSGAFLRQALPLFHPCQQRQSCHEKQPWLSSPGLTGRPSIPETPVMELRGRGVLDHPLSRVMTACFAAGAAARFFGNGTTPLSPFPAAPVLPRKTAPAPPWCSPGCGISGIEPWLSSPGLTGRPSIPATPIMESRGCGVLGHPLSRVMTACFAAGAAARFLRQQHYASFTLASSGPATKNSTSTAMVFTGVRHFRH